MPQEKASLAFKVSLIGLVLIFLNGIAVATSGGPIVLSTDTNLTTVDAINGSTVFWGRISFGSKGIVEGLWTPFWLIFAIALLWCIIEIYRKPRRHKFLSLPMVVLSLFSLPIGGGFLVGLILAFIGGMLALEWPKPFSGTFIGKMVKTVRFDSNVIRQLSNDPKTLMVGVSALLFTSIIMGLGNSMYAFNTNLIKTKPAAAYDIFLFGKLSVETLTIANTVSYMGIMFFRWLTLSLILYIITVRLKRHVVNFSELASATAFAFVPLCLQGFLPVLFSNEPYLSLHWPSAILLFSTFWVVLVVIALVRSTFEISTREALGVTILAGALYWFLELLIMSNPSISMPGVSLQFAPASSSAILLLISIATFVSILLGALTTKRGT